MGENDRPENLTAAEVADLEARQDGSLPPEARRVLRHGSGALARLAEALAQSRLFDDLAKSVVQRRALPRRADPQPDAPASALGGELAGYRREGLIWQARLRQAPFIAEPDAISSRGNTPTT